MANICVIYTKYSIILDISTVSNSGNYLPAGRTIIAKMADRLARMESMGNPTAPSQLSLLFTQFLPRPSKLKNLAITTKPMQYCVITMAMLR